MAKKLSDIKELVESSPKEFISYLEKNVDSDILSALRCIQETSIVYIFSGVIRNFFLDISEVRDLDIVLSSEVPVEKYFKDFEIRKNSFGGYKITKKNISLDIWFLDTSWAFKYQKNLNFENAKYMPSTAFFNFSSIMFNLNKGIFYYTKHFLRFLQNKEIDVVYKPNFNYELCVINSFYYSDKYHLRISDKLQKYLIYLNNKINGEGYEKTQIKHFGNILFSNSELIARVKNLKINEIKVKSELSMTYKWSVSSDLLTQFKKDMQTNAIVLSTHRDKEEWLNFTGPEIYDIIIYIKDNIILAPAVYDVFKTSLIALVERIKGSAKREINSKKISIRYEDQYQRNIEINIEGDYNKKELKSIISESLKIIETDEKEQLFNDTRYVTNSEFNPRIEMKYNPKTKIWEATNFEDIRKQFDDFLKKAENNFNG